MPAVIPAPNNIPTMPMGVPPNRMVFAIGGEVGIAAEGGSSSDLDNDDRFLIRE